MGEFPPRRERKYECHNPPKPLPLAEALDMLERMLASTKEYELLEELREARRRFDRRSERG